MRADYLVRLRPEHVGDVFAEEFRSRPAEPLFVGAVDLLIRFVAGHVCDQTRDRVDDETELRLPAMEGLAQLAIAGAILRNLDEADELPGVVLQP